MTESNDAKKPLSTREVAHEALEASVFVNSALLALLRSLDTGERNMNAISDLCLGVSVMVTHVDDICQRYSLNSPQAKELKALARASEKLLEQERKALG